MPQEMRSRFWYVLLERPDLVQALSVRRQLPRCMNATRRFYTVIARLRTSLCWQYGNKISQFPGNDMHPVTQSKHLLTYCKVGVIWSYGSSQCVPGAALWCAVLGDSADRTVLIGACACVCAEAGTYA